MDTMGMSRMTTVSAQIGMPRMAEASRMAQSTRFSPKSLTVALVMLTAAPVSSRTLPRMHPSTMTMAMLFSVSDMPLLMMPSILSHGVPIATICIMSSMSGADVYPVDIGIATDCDNPGVFPRKIKYGTDNMAKGPAMSREEAVKAIEVGIGMVADLKEKGYNVLATGEMGIGNTTTSSAVCSVLLDQSVEKVTGKGAGLTNKDLEHKIEVIRQSIALNKVNADDPLDVLAKVGGLDIAGMAGCYIGGAALNIPVFIDGFISSVAALIAIRLVPECAPYLFPSHCSNEPAGRMILDAIGKQPYIFANMCLGEGTGAVMGFTIADYAFKAYWELPSFEQTNFGTYEELN